MMWPTRCTEQPLRAAVSIVTGGRPLLSQSQARCQWLSVILVDGRNHAPEAFILTTLLMFFCGGFIGRKGFSANSWSDIAPAIAGTCVAVVGLPLLAGLSLKESLPFVGFASVGVVTTVAAGLLFLRWFPLGSSEREGS
jgi:hypothetical protein